MKPAQFSYAAWMMKSAESSAGWAPSTLVTQSGALSMIAGMAVLLEVAPALGAHGPLHRRADDGEHDRDRDGEREHYFLSSSKSRLPLARSSSGTATVSIRVPSGWTICSLMTPISGYTSVP